MFTITPNRTVALERELKGYHMVESVVRFMRPEQIKAMREQYTSKQRKKYRSVLLRQALREDMFAGDLTDIIPDLEMHHVKPVSFGGNNQPHNLVFVRSRRHKTIHEYIDLQTLNVDRRKPFPVIIPVRCGKLWL